ncbi:hypothetical protein BD410DRAFT_896745 [Rickenella mellea]|uniref:COP9 signalosome complex subunit 3 n=1 Tax=Rickenella mellea TaxID=50990 RepID=A0A4Y7QBD9_9AGAM|nr:hypothetical protein BD410DRAFT_896745 [Rickenella mellea]
MSNPPPAGPSQSQPQSQQSQTEAQPQQQPQQQQPPPPPPQHGGGGGGGNGGGNNTNNISNPALDTLINEITTATNILQLNKHLRSFTQSESREMILGSCMSGGRDPLLVLDVHRHTLGYLYLLSARFSYASVNVPNLPLVAEFCRGFDPAQARLAPDRVTMLAKGIVQAAEHSNILSAIIPPLFDLVTRYPPTRSHLTTLHPIFLRTCVSTRHFSSALPVLSYPITSIDTSLSDLTYNDHLVYHYAGGMALAALKRWADAEEFFEICVSAPAQAPAAVQMEALKKLTLVQLILYGKTKSVPKYTNQGLVRLLKSSPYGGLVRAYPSDQDTLNATLEKEEKLFTTDRNIGLLKQTMERAPRWRIKKLTETYITLSLHEIGRNIGIADVTRVRAMVLSMIEDNDIHATISADGTVTFDDPVPEYTKAQVEQVLAEAQAQTFHLAELDRAVGRSKEFLHKALKNKDDGAWGGEDLMGEKGASWAEEPLF